MKKITQLIFTITIALGLITSGCKKDETNDLIEANGLSRDINDFISEDIFDILDSLGMPINTGGNPANIEGTYLISPMVLIESNRTFDDIGKTYADKTFTFFDQNNDNLTLTTALTQGGGVGEGLGSFIVGNGNNFSVFVRIKKLNQEHNDSTLTTQIFSGTITSDGITDLYNALVMLDDYGDPNDRYIAIGDARVFYDEDGFSERIEEEKSIDINAHDEAIVVRGSLPGELNDE
jgi:hypothetical protein